MWLRCFIFWILSMSDYILAQIYVSGAQVHSRSWCLPKCTRKAKNNTREKVVDKNPYCSTFYILSVGGQIIDHGVIDYIVINIALQNTFPKPSLSMMAHVQVSFAFHLSLWELQGLKGSPQTEQKSMKLQTASKQFKHADFWSPCETYVGWPCLFKTLHPLHWAPSMF